MKPVKFHDDCVDYGAGQKEYVPMPALPLQDENGTILVCYKLDFWDRVRALLFGKVWHYRLTFYHNIEPQFLTTRNPFKIADTVEDSNEEVPQ